MNVQYGNNKIIETVYYEINTAITIKITAFRYLTLLSLTDSDHSFRGTCCCFLFTRL